MRILVLMLLLSSQAFGDALHLEFAQEGEPHIPRAIVVLHNSFEDRAALSNFLKAWSTQSWARRQFCSVYTYEYRGSGLTNLDLPAEIAKDLYSRIKSDNFEEGDSDDINPFRQTKPSYGAQPTPTFDDERLELMIAGHGHGGLVARELVLLAKRGEMNVKRVALVGSPLDGLSTTEMILAFTDPERSQEVGLTRPLTITDFLQLSPAWWHLPELFDSNRGWASYFAPATQDVLYSGAYGATQLLTHPTDRVLYGRNRKLVKNGEERDGLLPQPSAWGKQNGPIPWLKETVLKDTNHANLSENSSAFLLEELVDKEKTHNYLMRREGIELFWKERMGGNDAPVTGVYWDERYNRSMYAYATPKELYEMMWGNGI